MRFMMRLGLTMGLLSASWCAPAMAELVTVDFNPTSSFSNPSNLTDQGFRFSPNGYYNLLSNPGGGTYLNWEADPAFLDPAGNLRNPHYLGPASTPPGLSPMLDAMLYIDAYGTAFALKTINFILPLPGQNVTVLGSNGSIFTAHAGPGMQPQDTFFDSSLWSDLSWLLVLENEPGVPKNGIDHLVFAVPEASALALFAPALLLFAAFRRQRNTRLLSAIG